MGSMHVFEVVNGPTEHVIDRTKEGHARASVSFDPLTFQPGYMHRRREPRKARPPRLVARHIIKQQPNVIQLALVPAREPRKARPAPEPPRGGALCCSPQRARWLSLEPIQGGLGVHIQEPSPRLCLLLGDWPVGQSHINRGSMSSDFL
jgi:hypothetical protein